MDSTDPNFDSKDIAEVFNNLTDKICGGVSWIVNRKTPKKIAVEEYVNAIQTNDSLDIQTKSVLTYNAKRDIKHWANTTSICEKAANKLLPTSDVEKVDVDWINYFTECAGNISTEEMQEIWAIILAGECNNPGSIPKLLIHALSTMGINEAEDFKRLSSFCIKIDDKEFAPLIVGARINDYYSEKELSLNCIHRLETLGLININLNPIGGISIAVNESSTLSYFDKSVKVSDLKSKMHPQKGVAFGNVALSYIGEALMKIIEPEKVDGFFEEIALPYLNNPTKHIDDQFD